MKHFNMLSLTLLAVIAVGTIAFAAGLPHTPGNTIIQNLNGIAPVKGQSGCITKTVTKAPFGGYTTMDGFVAYKAEVVTAAGVAEPIKWELDGTQVAVGPVFEFTNSGGTTYSRVVQRPYSTAARSLTICNRRQ